MSKIPYIGISGGARKVKLIYFSNGTAKKIKTGYIGVNDVAKVFYESIKYIWSKYSVKKTYRWSKYNVTTSTAYKYYPITSYTTDRYVSDGSGPRVSNPVVGQTYTVSKQYFSGYTTKGYGFVGTGSATVTVRFTYAGYSNGYHQLIGASIISGMSSYDVFGGDYSSVVRRITAVGTILGTATTVSICLRGDTISQDFNYGDAQIVYGNYTEGLNSSMTGRYVRSSADDKKSKGSYVGSVSSSSSSVYPNNGVSGSYWYVSQGSSSSKGTYIGTVESDNPNAYPTNGVQGGYWYVKQ